MEPPSSTHSVTLNAFKSGLDGLRSASIGYFTDLYDPPSRIGHIYSSLWNQVRGRTWYVGLPGICSLSVYLSLKI